MKRHHLLSQSKEENYISGIIPIKMYRGKKNLTYHGDKFNIGNVLGNNQTMVDAQPRDLSGLHYELYCGIFPQSASGAIGIFSNIARNA
jgi:hypothetical protein